MGGVGVQVCCVGVEGVGGGVDREDMDLGGSGGVDMGVDGAGGVGVQGLDVGVGVSGVGVVSVDLSVGSVGADAGSSHFFLQSWRRGRQARRQRRHGGGGHGPPTQIIINNLCLLNLVICCHFLIGFGEKMTSVYNLYRQSCSKLSRPGVGLQLAQRRVA